MAVLEVRKSEKKYTEPVSEENQVAGHCPA